MRNFCEPSVLGAANKTGQLSGVFPSHGRGPRFDPLGAHQDFQMHFRSAHGGAERRLCGWRMRVCRPAARRAGYCGLYLSISSSAPTERRPRLVTCSSSCFSRSCAWNFSRAAARRRRDIHARSPYPHAKLITSKTRINSNMIRQSSGTYRLKYRPKCSADQNQALPTLSCAAAALTIIPNCPFLLKRRGSG
jgi:hypothetical protein